jgi:hypothetical protein
VPAFFMDILNLYKTIYTLAHWHISKSPNHQITKSPNHQITKSPN